MTESAPLIDAANADAPADAPLLQAVGLAKTYGQGSTRVEVLRDVAFNLAAGEFVTILGQSGSGKSTLLHLLGLLDEPTAGDIRYAGEPVSDVQTAYRLRNQNLGFVFQFYHLLPELDVLENVLLPVMVMEPVLRYHRREVDARREANALLDRLGLGHRATHRPSQLSGGEKQRTAIARALINRPAVLLADEPTGNLDRHTGEAIVDVLFDLHANGQSIVMVTHDESLAARGTRTVRLRDGQVEAV